MRKNECSCGRKFKTPQGLRTHAQRQRQMGNAGHKIVDLDDDAPKRRTRRKVKAAGPVVRFCPCCGANLDVIQAALQMMS